MGKWLHHEDTDMSKILVFSGTEDGRKVSEILAGAGHLVTVCVATEYGEEMMQKKKGLRVHCGRMDTARMEKFISDGDFDSVVDATHPYAREVSVNIKRACEVCSVPYLRMLRDSFSEGITGKDIYLVDTAADAAVLLSGKEGQIFLSTGSKELPDIIKNIDDRERLVIRMLPDGEAIRMCMDAGLKRKQLICMQGPFSEEMNAAMFRQTKCRFLVTKESGSTGGFPEKIRAARECGMEIIVIQRPKEEGLSFEEILDRFGVLGIPAKETKAIPAAEKKSVTLVGIGMGNRKGMTGEAVEALKEADLLIGAARMLDAVSGSRRTDQKTATLYLPDPIRECIDKSDAKKIAVLLSGDSGFYSGAKKLVEALSDYEVEVLPGISTVSALAAKWKISWDDMKIVSLHGRPDNIVDAVRHNRKVFALVGGKRGVSDLCRELLDCNLGNTEILVGSNLSYPGESLTRGVAADFVEYEAEGVSAVILLNQDAEERKTTHGIPDDAFIRGKVPMTKEEVRAVSLAKLGLHNDSVIYDIGAGTGSVSIECALRAPDGEVWAIEHNPVALELLEENRSNFGVSNLRIVSGSAPEAMESLPMPTHAFIGGSSGKLSKILDVLYQKNPGVRIVVNAISLETVAELTVFIKENQITDAEIVNLQVSRSKQVGSHHLMMANNPVYIVSF